jgi:hypothetical protein
LGLQGGGAIFFLPKNSFFGLLSGKGENKEQKYFIKEYLRGVKGEKKLKICVETNLAHLI